MSDIQINHPINPAPEGATTWDTAAMQLEFTVTGFCAPYVDVIRKSDGVKGLLEFNGQPRVYHSFREA